MASAVEHREQMWVVLSEKHTTIIAERVKFTYRENQDGGDRHIEFQKMSISPDWMKIFPPKLVARCITAIWRLSQML